jgi:hypothetical protein
MLKKFESALKQLQLSFLYSVFHQVILCITPKNTLFLHPTDNFMPHTKSSAPLVFFVRRSFSLTAGANT